MAQSNAGKKTSPVFFFPVFHRPSPLSNPPIRPGLIWSFTRDILARGEAVPDHIEFLLFDDLDIEILFTGAHLDGLSRQAFPARRDGIFQREVMGDRHDDPFLSDGQHPSFRIGQDGQFGPWSWRGPPRWRWRLRRVRGCEARSRGGCLILRRWPMRAPRRRRFFFGCSVLPSSIS